jgi:CBS domain-containing protein
MTGLDPESRITAVELQLPPCFNENTSIWKAMQVMRAYMGAAIAVVDSNTGRYLGAVPESVVINAYLDASENLRREEHEV